MSVPLQMASLRLLIGFFVVTASFAAANEVGSSLAFDVEAAKNRPVTKVINLLNDMKKQLEAEAEEDEEMYEKMSCWCETNDKEKTKSIADASQHIKDLNVKIEELTASSARISQEIKTLEAEVSKNQGALDKATALRMKELGEFNEEEKDMLQTVKALDSAIIVLSKHHGASMLQLSGSKLFRVATVMQHELQKHAALLDGVLTPSQKRKIAAFAQSPEDYFDSSPTFKQAYAPQSGQIIGILKQMKETFESNLSTSQKDELAGQKAYSDLKAAKEDEIAACADQLELKTQELADTDQKLADAKQDLEDTEASLAADEKFLAMLKEQCQKFDQEYEQRSKTRAEEIAAVSKATEFLSSDDAQDLFSRTFNSFLQVQGRALSKRRAQASKLLSDVARKNQNPQLMALALSVRLDAFTKVKKAINDMIAQLVQEKQDEIKQKDFCREGFNENLRYTEDKEREKKSLTETIDGLTMTIDDLKTSIETLKAEIEQMRVQMKRAGEDREKENKLFQETVADQRATQKLLKQALEVLQGFYNKKAFLQKSKEDPVGFAPPPGFKAYKKNESGGGVMAMIQQIINDAKAEENEAIVAESDAQKAYESFVKDTNASINEKTKDIINKTEEQAKAEAEKVKSEETLENVVAELDQLSSENADLHKACDFVMKNFEIRQTARDQEIEALKQVLQILSGAKFSEFLQGDAFADAGSSMTDASAAPEVDPLSTFLDGV